MYKAYPHNIGEALKAGLKYCEIVPHGDYIDSFDIHDIADDFPFASVTWNPTSRRYDVSKVSTSTEAGITDRVDTYVAKSCDMFAIVAICRAMHLDHKPMLSPRAYLNPTVSKAASIFDDED